MALSVTFNGVVYTIPTPGESNDWGTALNAFFVALGAARPTTAVVGQGVGAGAGVTGVGGSSSGYGGVFTGGTADGYGVSGSGNGSGSGGFFKALGTGYGLHVRGDLTSPVRAALRVEPQDNAPSGPNLIGDIYVTTAGVLWICTVAGTPGTFTKVGAQ
jgi:hypothetical protein